MRTEHVTVALSVDAWAQQMARRDACPAGTAVVVDTEIAGRLRGGVEWRPDDAVAVAVIHRPAALDPASAGAAWLAAALAAAVAFDDVVQVAPTCWWPDRVELPDRPDVPVVTGALTLLGPGQVEVAITIVRIDRPDRVTGDRAGSVDRVVDALRDAAGLLDSPQELADRYAARCGTLGRDVAVRLLPSGSLRGRAAGVRADGSLEIATRTGLIEVATVPSTGEVAVDAPDRG